MQKNEGSFLLRGRDIIVSLMFGLALLGFACGKFLTPDRKSLLGSDSYTVFLSLALLAWLLFDLVPRNQFFSSLGVFRPFATQRFSFVPATFLLLYPALFLTDLPRRRYAFLDWDYSRLALLVVAVITVGTLACLRRKTLSDRAAFFGLVITQLAVAFAFVRHVDGRLFFGDDHSSFLYRLHLLKTHFPFIPFYNPDWNAGFFAREFFPSGVLNVFFCGLPIVIFADFSSPDGAAFYPYLIAWLFIFVVPYANYLACRVFGFSVKAGVVAALLSLAPTMGFFEWLLKFGTIGFLLSAGLLPLAVASGWKLLLRDDGANWTTLFSFFVVSSLCLFWTLSFLALVPLAVLVLFKAKTVFAKERVRFIFALFALFVLLHGPWIKSFIADMKVASFVAANKLPGAKAETADTRHRKVTQKEMHSTNRLTEALRFFRQHSVRLNPLLLLLALPALFSVRNRELRTLYAATITWLILLSVLGEKFKPQLELRRMMIIAGFFLSTLAAPFLVAKLSEAKSLLNGDTFRFRSLAALLVAMTCVVGVLSSPLTAAAAYSGRTIERLVLADDLPANIGKAIREHGGSGRTLFSSFILHELGSTKLSAQDGGHIAPIAAFSGKPLYASDFYHSRWSQVDPIPRAFRRRGDTGIEEFLDLINVTAIVTHRREWVRFCQRRGYQEVFHQGRFRLFRRNVPSSYFLDGSGTVEEGSEGIVVRPASEQSVLKFRYYAKLKVGNPSDAQIRPIFAFDEERGGGVTEPVYFIALQVSPEALKEGKPVSLGFWPSRN